MNNKLEIDLIYQIAHLYYDEGLTQEQIAHQFGFNRIKIQRYLETAKEEGIVQIAVVNPLSRCLDTEKKIKEKFNLNNVIVNPSLINNDAIIRKILGRAAAQYLNEVIQDGDHIGIGWGRTVYETLKYLQPNRKIAITVVPLIGGIGQVAADFQVNEMARKLSEQMGGTFVPLYAPAIVDNESIVNALFSDRNFGKVTKLWEKLDLALIGIGGKISNDSYLPISSLTDNDLKIMNNNSQVGDILMHCMDKDGSICHKSLTKRIVGISLEDLKNTKTIIAVAGSIRKKDAILACLKSEYIDVLITDQTIANEIIN